MQSMEEIYQEYAQMVYRYPFSLSRNHHIAEEVTQETFYQAIRSIHRFDGFCKISTWLCSIAKKQLSTYYRKHPINEDWSTLSLFVASAETEAIANMNWTEFLDKMHNCPEPFREVLYLRLFGELSFREIGTILNQTENWARVTYYRGKEKFRKELENNEY